MADKLFYFLSFVALLSGLMVVLSKNPVHSVLYLIVSFFALSGHYILLNAQFLAVVNVIVYAGAIMVLFLFVIMFLNMREDMESHKPLASRFAAVVSAGLLGLILIAALVKVDLGPLDTAAYANHDSQIGLVANLGKVLYTDFLLPFELASVLLTVALVGAVMLGRREEGESNTF